MLRWLAAALCAHATFFGFAGLDRHRSARSDAKAPIEITFVAEAMAHENTPLAEPPHALPKPHVAPRASIQAKVVPPSRDDSEPATAPSTESSVHLLPDHLLRDPAAGTEFRPPPGRADSTATPLHPPPPEARQDVGTALRSLTQRDTGMGDGPGHGSQGGLRGTYSNVEDPLPVIQGNIGFGHAKKGPLKGKLCFVDPGTQRLKSVNRCRAVGLLYASVLDVSPRQFTHGFPGVSDRFEWFALDFAGKFHVAQAGRYQFRLLSDDGSILWIDGVVLIDNDGQHPPTSKLNSIDLDAGPHRLRVFYYQGPRTQVALQLFVTPPGGVERLWTPEL